jgi:hypothetical protein
MSLTLNGLADAGPTGSWDDKGKREYTAVYKITSTSANVGPQQILSCPGLPIPGISYYAASGDLDAQAICRRLTPSRVDGRLIWLVTASFATDPEDDKRRDEDGKPESDPYKWADQISLGGAQFQRPLEKAIYREGFKGGAAGETPAGKEGPPKNSAGVVFSPPFEIDDSRKVLRITKVVDKFPTSDWLKYQDAINSDTWTFNKKKLGFTHTFEKYTAKCQSIEGVLKVETTADGPIRYWEVTYEIHGNKKGWRVELLDQGFHAAQRAGDDDGHGGTVSSSTVIAGQPRVRRLMDPDGHPVSEPQLLDGDGQPLAANAEPVYITYSGYDELPFAKLGL